MATPSETPNRPTFRLKLAVDKCRNRVVFAESGKGFLEVLLCFLKVPLGTISRLYSKNSAIGSIDNLYKSVEDLNVEYFNTKACKHMLLRPKIVAEANCNNLKTYDASAIDAYYRCHCASHYPNQIVPYEGIRCGGGVEMTATIAVSRQFSGPFINGMTSFIITDDMIISPSSTDLVMALTEKLEDNIEFKDVDVGKEEIIQLVQQASIGRMPLTSTFLGQQMDVNLSEVKKEEHTDEKGLLESEEEEKKWTMVVINLMVDKRNGKVIYAESEHDFVDILVSFLTFPLGLVIDILRGNEELEQIGSTYNLYNSVDRLSSIGSLNDSSYKDMLTKPKLPIYFGIGNKLLNVTTESVECAIVCYYCSKVLWDSRCPRGCTSNPKLIHLDPKQCGEIKIEGGFMEKAKYMVTDELVITPFCSSSSFSLLRKAGFHPQAVEKRTVSIGPEEAKKLLLACLTSKMPLTAAFLL